VRIYPTQTSTPQGDEAIYYSRGFRGPNPYRRGFLSDDGFVRATCALAAERSRRIDEILRRQQDAACIYCESELPAGPIRLSRSGDLPTKEKHWQVVRALIQLHN
jgi:hypothetical protein